MGTLGLHQHKLPSSKYWIYVALLLAACYENGALAVFTACGGKLTDQAGVILSPNFPNNYPNDATCYWNITVAPNQIIDFRFRRLDLDRNGDQSCNDWVRLFDGPSTQYPVMLEYYGNWAYNYHCGSSNESRILNMAFRSSSNHMYVVFQSNYENTRIGFSASYWAHECQPFKYGKEVCNNTCVCNQNNTLFCVSLNGTCACKTGWTSVDCTVDINECQDPNRCEDPYSQCVNTPGSYVCQCKPGMIKNASGLCEVANMCTQKKCSHACSVTSKNPPIETCYCPKGMKLDRTNNHTCIECESWTYGENCSYVSECNKYNTKSYNKSNGLCSCHLNFTGSTCTDDVNECWPHPPCSPVTNHAICYNTIGSFECTCQMGFEQVNSTTCDKCGKTITDPSGIIKSTDHGPYSSNYVECSWIIKASQGNVISYKFQSLSLWYDSDTYHESRPAYIEIYDGSNTSSKLLAIFNGGPSYSLPQGIIRSSSNEMFIIQYTGFKNGYTVSTSNGFSAVYWTHECQPFTYNSNCTQSCSCVINNTQYCNSTNGQCVCKTGWTGTSCSVDVDECLVDPLSCPDYSDCQNTVGSFECKCKEGLTRTSDKCVVSVGVGSCTSRNCSHVCVAFQKNGQRNEKCYCPIGMELERDTCVACKNNKYGPECSRNCSCVQNNTLSCDTRTGECICLPLWKGKNCSIDYDVCTPYSRNECQKYANCTNTGSLGYRCRCSQNDGYVESSNGSCVPINCSYVSTNNTGLITSPLYPGYYMNNAFCTWFISVQDDNVISLRFDSGFYIYDCSDDFLEVFDGDSNKTRLIGHYCGTSISSVIRTNGNKMYITFKSNWVYNSGHFRGIYTSHDCRTFKYGTDSCDKPCKCVKENTDFCDNVNGECICKPGWTLRDCSTDVDECLGTNNKVCPTNSDCINTVGSYKCKCHMGYKFNTTNRTCDVSNECLYKKCSHTCYVIGLGIEKCACPDDFILDTLTESICVVPYYPFGENVTDQLLSNSFISYNNIFESLPVYFSYGAPYGYSLHPAAFILSNGVIGFGSTVMSSGGYQNLIYANDKHLDILAPFMTNIDPFIGQVYYHLYEKCAVKLSDSDRHISSVMNAVISRAEKDIKKYKNISDFEVSTVLIATWAGVRPYGSNKPTGLNTFQALYISGWEEENGEVAETAYTIFLYQYGLMKWDYLSGRQISIGTTGDFTNILQDLDTTLVSVLDRVPGNTGYKGVMSFKVGHVTGPQMTCKKYLCDHASLLNDPVYQYETDQLFKCPCTLERLGAQWQLFERRGPNQDIYCYAISMVAKQRLLQDNKRNKLCCYRWIKPSSDDWREWLQSWRDATYLPKSPESGHVLINDPWSRFPDYFNNYQALENIQTHRLCCRDSDSAMLCDQFYQIFPDYGCTNFVEFVSASALGDPHFTTLDGLTYTMNGWGEYVMLENPSENFTLQTRTGQAEAYNGTLINATVFIAFAARESNESKFQVELSSSKTSLILMANEIDITNDFYKEDGPDIIMSTTTISVIREYRNNKTFTIVTFPCGVSITIHVAVKSLIIEVNVPKSFSNKTKGLLGNFNGNKSDEFILPDGNVLPGSLTERQIYEQFAPKWVITSENSAFIYRPGENTSTYQHPDFVPKFGDEADQSQSAEANSICGDKDYACKFDYLATGDKKFTQNTKNVGEEMETLFQNLANSPPTVQVMNGSLDKSGRWLVKQGKQSNLRVTAHDANNDSITFETLEDFIGIGIDQTGYIHFTPDLTKPILLRIRAKDAKGSYSPFLFIPITICPLCNGKGVCDDESVIFQQYENGWFQIQSCKCFPAYTGKECESELDACKINPCFVGQNCTDLTAEQQGNNSVGYKCGPCPTGYTEWNGTCVDLDECNNVETCEGSCTNTEGSYICSCPDGYRLNVADKKSCLDINECEERTSACQQKCINNKGNYTCSCYSMYTLDSNGQTCTLDRQKQSSCYECQQICQITGSSQVNCSCRIGYEVDPKDPTNCRDINECQSGNKPCSHNCFNVPGSYNCSCYTGYKLAVDQISCEACKSPNYGEDCAKICQCNSRGACDPVRGCVCNKQWTGVNCEIDVNECTQPNICPSGYVCENTIGSYKCQCPTGYTLKNETCQDINECIESSNITCNLHLEVCANTIGSYRCVCRPGYARHENICQDIDECTSNINDCEQMCINKPGTYNCQCYAGYILNDDRKTCSKKAFDECVVKNMNCSYGCRRDSNYTAVCFCPQGYKVNDLGQCEDINECISDELNLCANKNGCTNTNGTYTCACQIGSKLDNNGRTCIACSGETWGLECNTSCSCGLGSDHCDPKTGCVCKAGFTGILCDQDINECQSGSLNCTVKEKCVNTPGSANCVCLDGYKKMNGECQDVDECSYTNLNNCTQHCTNLEGSFTCSCFPGYSHNENKTCTDIDECKLGSSKCEGLCINTEGSYRCSCRDGLVLQPDGLKCGVSVPCVDKKNCSNQCAKINGTETCLCPKGKVLNANEISCDDLDLCAYSPCTFGCVETKDNTSFECVCKTGQILSADIVTCIDCTEGRWGVACNNTCQCQTTNTEYCDKVNGGCHCKTGWNGTLCDQDINECLNTSLCPTHTQCKNTDGGYLCVCVDGYITTNVVNATCKECDEGYFGPSCSQKCSCGINFNCNKTNGSCYCKAGWNGTNCDLDINECDVGTHSCNISKYERCVNTQGSYDCTCSSGYSRKCSSCECEEVSQFNASVTFDMDVKGRNLEDVNSVDFKILKSDIEDQLLKKLKEKNLSIFSVTVIKLRTGSLISDVIIQMNAENPELAVQNAMQDLLSDNFKLDNTNVMMITVSVHGSAVEPKTCEVRQIINPCLVTEECILDNGISACNKKQSDNMRLILGLAIGIPLFILLCIVIAGIVYFCTKKQKTSKDIYNENIQTDQINMHVLQSPSMGVSLNEKQKRDASFLVSSRKELVD